MALDKANEMKVSKWLASKGQLACPLCQGKSWGIGDVVGSMIVPTPLAGGAFNLAGARVALAVQLTCTNCAYIVHLSAPQVGIAPDKLTQPPA